MRGLGQHAAVADQHHPRPSETATELVDLHAHGGRVGGVAVEHLDRHRTPLGVAQQAETRSANLPRLASRE